MYFALGKIIGSRPNSLQHFMSFWKQIWNKFKSLSEMAKLAFKSMPPKTEITDIHSSLEIQANLTEVSAQNLIQIDFHVEIASFSLDGKYLRCVIYTLI